MPLFTTDALILRTYKLGEADRIVVFLTRDRGKKRGVAKGARRPRSRFTGALEPMTSARVAYFEREHRELVGLNYVEPQRSPLATAHEGLGLIGYFAELIDECAPEADPNEKLYRLGTSALEALLAGAPLGRLARYFEYWLLRLQGVYPSALVCPRCGSDLREGGAHVSLRDRVFVCGTCGPATAVIDLSPEALGFVVAASRFAPGQLVGVDLSPEADRELELAHRTLIACHLEKELKSVKVLKGLTRPG